ncbi:MAG TPA: ATP-dependent zinc metalloprotease FtsH [Acidimicrobiales bacterium]|nr:ATP-dependent zinc metalloprotease FtsH [Acidimicrobiales bacterium]
MTSPASTPPTRDSGSNTAPPKPPAWRHWLLVIALALFVLLFFLLPATRLTSSVSLTYTQFLHDVTANKVKTVTLGQGGTASGTLKNGTSYTTVIPSQLGSPLLNELDSHGVGITATSTSESFASEVLSWVILLLPLVVLGYFWWRLSKNAAGQFQGAFGIGKSHAQVFDEERPKTTFADVAGYDGPKLEIREVVDFLGHPERYAQAGAKPPRGILMVGPPGTGKTLFARAVAGEADVPFFSVTGSSFVEMYVGVGAARVRDLFAQARKRAPSIIFIDEIDAIGQRRGSGGVVANDEREQTLNQMLAEMDGFDPATGVVVLAATNRPEILDPALLRPGRFDRQVTIPLPTLPEREAILKIHCRDKRLDPTVDLSVVARGTPGFSGADLANLVNEAAIVAVRAGRDVIVASDFDAARDRIILGQREGSNVLLPDEKYGVAVHESGHALVAAYSDRADPVAKVTILPAGQALGVTEQLPLVERHMYGEGYLRDTLAVMMGGRASEVLELGEASTGASSDLARATELAVKMVREFGLSPEIGPVSYPSGGSVFLGDGGSEYSSRPYAEKTQAEIDDEVARILREAEKRATDLLTQHRDVLHALVNALMAQETVDGRIVYQLAGRPYPSGGAPATIAPRRAAAVSTTSVAATSQSSVAAKDSTHANQAAGSGPDSSPNEPADREKV